MKGWINGVTLFMRYGDQVVGTILAVDTFLGALLGISSKKYNAATGSEEN